MSGLSKWWLLLALVIVIPGVARYQARNTFSAESARNSIIQRVRLLLKDRNYEIVGEVLDSDSDNRLIGYRFKNHSCAGEMSVIAFSIILLSETFVSDYVSTDDVHKFYYHNYGYSTSSRPTVILLWAKNLILRGLNLGGSQLSKRQLAVVWPRSCSPVDLDWSEIWEQQTRLDKAAVT